MNLPEERERDEEARERERAERYPLIVQDQKT